MGVLRHLVMQEIVSVRSLLTPRWSCPDTPHPGRCHSSSPQCLTESHAVRGANYECGDSQHASLARQRANSKVDLSSEAPEQLGHCFKIRADEINPPGLGKCPRNRIRHSPTETCRLLYATCSFLSRNFIYLTTISSIGTGSQRKFACEFGGIEINLRRSPCNSLIRLLLHLSTQDC